MKETITIIPLILNKKILPLKSKKIGKKHIRTISNHLNETKSYEDIKFVFQKLLDLKLIQIRTKEFYLVNNIFQFLKFPEPYLKKILIETALYVEGKVLTKQLHKVIKKIVIEHSLKEINTELIQHYIDLNYEFKEQFHPTSIESGIVRYIDEINKLQSLFPENYFSETLKSFMISPDLKLYLYQDTPPEIILYICNFAKLISVDTFITFEISKEVILQSINDEIEVEDIQKFIKKNARSVPDTLTTLFQEIHYHHKVSHFKRVDILSADASVIAEIWRNIDQDNCQRINGSTLLLGESTDIDQIIAKVRHLNIQFSFNWGDCQDNGKINGTVLISILNQLLKHKELLHHRYYEEVIQLRNALLQSAPEWINHHHVVLKISQQGCDLNFYEKTVTPKHKKDLAAIKRFLKQKIIKQERLILVYKQLSDHVCYKILVRPLFFDDRSLIAFQEDEQRTFLLEQIFDLSDF